MGDVWTVSASVAVCDSALAVPVKVTVDDPVVAPMLAVSVTFCAVPGVSVSDAGSAVMPAGRPVMLTATGEAKPAIAATCRESAVPLVPLTSVCDVGVTVKTKSGVVVAVVVSATVAVWLSVPEVPVSVTVAEPLATTVSAVKVTFCAAPAIKVSAAGFAVTPAGNPLSATVTGEVNPFIALALTLTDCPLAPALTEVVAGETPRVKSGVVVFAGMWVPPQPVSATEIPIRAVTAKQTRSSNLHMPEAPMWPQEAGPSS
jgi:hypothetical protein